MNVDPLNWLAFPWTPTVGQVDAAPRLDSPGILPGGALAPSSEVVGGRSPWIDKVNALPVWSGDPASACFIPSVGSASAGLCGVVDAWPCKEGSSETGERLFSEFSLQHEPLDSAKLEGLAAQSAAAAVSRQTVQALVELQGELEAAPWRGLTSGIQESDCPLNCGGSRREREALDILFDSLLSGQGASIARRVSARLEEALLEQDELRESDGGLSGQRNKLTLSRSSTRESECREADSLPSLEGLFATPDELPPAPLLLDLLRSVLPTSKFHSALRHCLALREERTGQRRERRKRSIAALKVQVEASDEKATPGHTVLPNQPLRCAMFPPPKRRTKKERSLQALPESAHRRSGTSLAFGLPPTCADSIAPCRRELIAPKSPDFHKLLKQSPSFRATACATEVPALSSPSANLHWRDRLEAQVELPVACHLLPPHRRLCVLQIDSPDGEHVVTRLSGSSGVSIAQSKSDKNISSNEVLWDLCQVGASLEAFVCQWLAESEMHAPNEKGIHPPPPSFQRDGRPNGTSEGVFDESQIVQSRFRSLSASLRLQLSNAQRREADFTLLVQLRRRERRQQRKQGKKPTQKAGPAEDSLEANFLFTQVLELDVLDAKSGLRLRDCFLWCLDSGDAAVNSHVQQMSQELNLPRRLAVQYHYAMQRQIEEKRAELVFEYREELCAAHLRLGLGPPFCFQRGTSPKSALTECAEADSQSASLRRPQNAAPTEIREEEDRGGEARSCFRVSGFSPSVRNSWFQQSGLLQRRMHYALRTEGALSLGGSWVESVRPFTLTRPSRPRPLLLPISSDEDQDEEGTPLSSSSLLDAPRVQDSQRIRNKKDQRHFARTGKGDAAASLLSNSLQWRLLKEKESQRRIAEAESLAWSVWTGRAPRVFAPNGFDDSAAVNRGYFGVSPSAVQLEPHSLSATETESWWAVRAGTSHRSESQDWGPALFSGSDVQEWLCEWRMQRRPNKM